MLQKSDSGLTKAADMRRRRERARALGLCITCHHTPVAENRSTCSACNVRAKTHVERMRDRRKQYRARMKYASTCEAAGDAAMLRFSYIEATMQFERALERTASPEDEERLCEKIALTICFGSRPDRALEWYERALQSCSITPSLRGRIPYMLAEMPTQYWLASRTRESGPFFDRAREAMNTNGALPRERT